jgi:uncharacterized protein
VRQQLLDLYEIQKIDLTIRDIDKRRQAIPKHLNELDAVLNTQRTQLAQVTEQRDGLLRETRTLESTIHGEQDKLRKWEKRLSDIRNQREYLALSREVEGSKRANREAEEQIQVHNKSREDLDKQIETLQDALAEQTVDRDAEAAKVAKEMAEVEQLIATEKARRSQLVGKVPANLLRRYDSIREKRMGMGLVPAADGGCSGCNMKLPPQLYNILQRVDTIEQCPSCQRIVFWDGILAKEAEKSGSVEARA